MSSGNIPLFQKVLKRKRYCRIAAECQIELPHPCFRVQRVSQMKWSMANAVVTAAGMAAREPKKARARVPARPWSSCGL